MSKKEKNIYIVLGGLFLIALVTGISYAYWSITHTQSTENVVNSDCFEITFEEKNPITINNAYPISDEEGLQGEPYTFTITNKCSSWANYQINLETLSQSSNIKVLPEKYLKVNLQEGTSSKITTKLDKEINPNLDTSTTITEATEAYKLLTGTLKENASKTYNLRLWMHSEVTAEDTDSMNSSYKGKVSIVFSYAENPFRESGTLMAYKSTKAFWQYKSDITKVVFEPELLEKENAIYSFDVSETQDGSVMSYLVSNEPSEEENLTYTLYIQGKGGVKGNKDCSYLFYNFANLESIEGFKYFDTSNVTYMGSMFSGCSGLTSIDLSPLDTSNVTNMYSMFYGCSGLTSIDLSPLDTSNVTYMYTMFQGCSGLTSIDLSSLNTSNVTNIQSMFYGCSSLTSLDLSNFDTSQVTSMGCMFYGCSSLTSLDLSTFDTSNVTNMGYMFEGCRGLTSIDISHFDTSNVTNMYSMFKGCSGLTSLDLSTFDISSVTYMGDMFSNMSSSVIIKVKDETVQNWILTGNNSHPSTWTTENVIIA